MTTSLGRWSALAILTGLLLISAVRRKTMKPMMTRAIVRADAERYRRYAVAKSKIPMNLPPLEYEREIKKLARRYKI
jgi:hypothetical protein